MPNNYRHISIKDHEYPSLLKEIASPPQRLWLMGAPLKNSVKHLTVVGTRTPTNYGKRVVNQLVKDISSAGITIVSGLALGIDGLAHQAALEVGGHTVSILAGGLDRIHPRSNEHIAKKILETGGTLVSEYPEGVWPSKQNFVIRNRIQSGISEAVLVIEAAPRSGTLITAQFALEQGRTVLAVPGNINSKLSQGTNQLIKDGAIPVTSAEDVLLALNVNLKASKVADYKPENQLETKLLELIKTGIHKTEELKSFCKIDISDLSEALTILEVKGIIYKPDIESWDLT